MCQKFDLKWNQTQQHSSRFPLHHCCAFSLAEAFKLKNLVKGGSPSTTYFCQPWIHPWAYLAKKKPLVGNQEIFIPIMFRQNP